jgi:hypothetical protein
MTLDTWGVPVTRTRSQADLEPLSDRRAGLTHNAVTVAGSG